ncbi:protein EPIDERMAL PATTERNING FACTOR 2 isoform X2 [Argentina anserina]|uniref:protein EPIDERMAL PATTERNING FACTOR 2 isoform X2 n=1 Tax=Argentina anserina TaxID=57926 RepID=UPI0021762014|nr:protein EPIDERMAL PATTERNING FACTOR 2 isoform X2 [Potentilla anserina]
MKNLLPLGVANTSLLLVIFSILILTGTSLRVTPHPYLQRKVTSTYNRDDVRTYLEKGGKKEVGTKMEMELYPTRTGSSLPDCSHACGPCFPCKRVMVSFSKCSSTSESCPIVYRCICKGKYYHVPGL